MKPARLFPLMTVFVLAVLAWVMPDLKAKNDAQRRDTVVSVAVDWEDIVTFGADINTFPMDVVVMSPTSDLADEARMRAAGKRILWRLDDDIRPDPWMARFRDEDGVFIAGGHVLEHPRFVRDLPNMLRAHNGYLVLMEFVPDALLAPFASRLPDRLIKGHVLPTRVILTPNERLWRARLVRAVEERWIRLLVIRLSPALSLDENRAFQRTVVDELTARGYTTGPPQPFPAWRTQSSLGFRLKLALLISVIMPLAILIWAFQSEWPPFLVFFSASLATILAGIAIHGLGATSGSVVGLQMMRGVKIQLALPLLLAAILLLSRDEMRRLFNAELKVKHVLWTIIGIGALGGIYLMRSGNFPIIPVSDGERHFRDVLDRLLLARPRFKEFLIGHPLFLIGLAYKKRFGPLSIHARALLWFGLIGQISILNTFTHFPSPLMVGLVRTFNGLWLGCLLAVPAVLLVHSRK